MADSDKKPKMLITAMYIGMFVSGRFSGKLNLIEKMNSLHKHTLTINFHLYCKTMPRHYSNVCPIHHSEFGFVTMQQTQIKRQVNVR